MDQPQAKKKKDAVRPRHFTSILNRMVVMITLTLFLMILGQTVLLMSINYQYSLILQNATIAADFNSAFKESIDTAMYSHVIQPRTEHSVEELPMEELDNAVEVLLRLEETTTLRDNSWRLSSMLLMCENLRNYMIEIAQCEQYDTRMELLERNIRGETGLTLLIQDYMHAYVDEEVREMARLQHSLDNNLLAIMIGFAVIIVLSIVLIASYAMRVSKRITTPISKLVEKARDLGQGEFHQQPVETDIMELQVLDHGFDEMTEQIISLIDKQRQDQQDLHRAELELLQAQINPHFLYNTLDSISILAEMGRTDDVSTMVSMLSTFFRTSLSNGRDIIPLEDEIRQVTSYLEIQTIRYSDILSYEIDIPKELYPCLMPKLILQPLVENALYHGIKNKRALGKITITGEQIHNTMIIRIQDNGAGMTAEQLNSLRTGLYEDKHTGLGLLNVYQRIQLYCGKQYGLSFESAPGIGTTVSVTLPTDLPADIMEEFAHV